MSEKQTRLRRLWTLFILFNGEEARVQDIEAKLNFIDSYLEKFGRLEDLRINMTPSIQAKILKYLENNHVVKKEERSIPNSNLKVNYWSIPNDFSTFLEIVSVINFNYVKNSFKNFILRSLMNSIYGKTHINDNLLPKLCSEHKVDLKFKDQEKELITFILRSSPMALNYTISSITEKSSEWETDNSDPNDIKKNYFYIIMGYFNVDALDPLKLHDYSVYPQSFNSTMITRFDDIAYITKNDKIDLGLENKYLKISLNRDFQPEDITYKDILSKYLLSQGVKFNKSRLKEDEKLSKVVFNIDY